MPIDYSGEEGNAYHKARHHELFGNKLLVQAWGDYARVAYFERVKEGDVVLEVGAGLGNNLVGIKTIASVYAVEPAPSARDFGQSMGISMFASLDDLPLDVRYDCILVRHVLEHVPEPRELLIRLGRLLTATGTIVLVVPAESPYAPDKSDDLNHHLYCWNRQTIKNLIEHAGLRALNPAIRYHNGRRIFLPVYKLIGIAAYAKAIQVLGKLTGAAEIVVEAQQQAPVHQGK